MGMRVDIVTLFPEMCQQVLDASIIGRAAKRGYIETHCHQIRDYTLNKQKQTDDYPYGGGCGMVLYAQPIADCLRAVQKEVAEQGRPAPHIVFLTAGGQRYTEEHARRLAQYDNLTLVCGHYEGIDERVIDAFADEELSIGDYILTGDEAKQAAMNHAELMAIVHADRLNARTEPSTDAKIWTQISENERYHVAEQLDGWVKIEFDESGEGDGDDEISAAYVSSEFVEVRYALSEAIKFSPTEESASLRSRIVNYAMKFLGNPYVWGGTSLTHGTDCSGFTMSVYKKFGYRIPRTSREQSTYGKKVNFSHLAPGDLIFYTHGTGRVNHVAMYIGNGNIVHASNPKTGIKISKYNYSRPKCARRIAYK